MTSARCTFAASLLCLSLALISNNFAAAQQRGAVQKNRIAEDPELRTGTTLHGNIPRWAAAANDRGTAADETPMRLTFVLSRSPELQASFTQLLEDQQNPNSASYHQWLTPQQVGEQYGPTQHDVDAFTTWLGSQGLTVLHTAPSRMFVDTVAPASAVARALSTSFHSYDDAGQPRLSASTDPTIPAAFASVVSSVTGLADLAIVPMHHSETVPMASLSASTTQAETTGPRPQFTSSGGLHYITPGDFATIFNVRGLYSVGYTGTGQKIAIIGRSRIVASDVAAFEAKTGLVSNVVNTIIPPTGVDPGITLNGDEGEAILDVQRAIGTAPGAQVDLVVSGSAGGFNGLYVAAQYEVQTLRDPIMNISFGACEAYAGPSQVALWDTLFAQAASEGISVFVSSADSGAATCNTQFGTPQANQFRSINYICSSSYATCVGGTQLAQGTNGTPYWSTTNGSDFSSALGYIPEGAWNEPGVNTPHVVAGGGGGASIYIPKPSWQTGTGVPTDGARDVPDLSFPSASNAAYFICYASSGGDCSNNFFSMFYGTSAAAPAMAGITALMNQKTGSSQGNMNPLLYRLAANSPSAFHDATPASSGVSCDVSIASKCNNTTPGLNSLSGGVVGYALTTGYDQATGLGSLDVSNFVNAAVNPKSTLAATTLALRGSATLISNTQTAVFTATLTSAITNTPSGSVQFYANSTALGTPIAVVAGKAVTAAIPFPSAGSYFITAVYSGDVTYAASTAPGVALNVSGLIALTKVTATSTVIPVGTTASFTATVTPPLASTTTTFPATHSPLAGPTVSAGLGFGDLLVAPVPTGSVRFLAAGSTNDAYVAIVPLVGGVATTPAITFSKFGNYTLSAQYVGDAVYSPSISVGIPIAVQKLVSVNQISTSSATIGVGGSKGLAWSIQRPVGTAAAIPSGTMQFFANGVALGAPIVLNPIQANSTVSLFPTAGTYAITAVYSGDSNWAPSTSNALSVNVISTPASYQLSAPTPTMTLRAGGGDAYSFSVTGALGLVGPIAFRCTVVYNGTVSPNVLPTCSFNGGPVNLSADSAGPFSTNMSVSASLPSGALVSSRTAKGQRLFGGGGPVFCALLLCLLPLRRRGTRLQLMTTLVVLAGAFLSLGGCGGSSGSGASVPAPGTAPGSYTITINSSTTVPGIAVPPPLVVALTVN
jgi:pseudomonalisin